MPGYSPPHFLRKYPCVPLLLKPPKSIHPLLKTLKTRLPTVFLKKSWLISDFIFKSWNNSQKWKEGVQYEPDRFKTVHRIKLCNKMLISTRGSVPQGLCASGEKGWSLPIVLCCLFLLNGGWGWSQLTNWPRKFKHLIQKVAV